MKFLSFLLWCMLLQQTANAQVTEMVADTAAPEVDTIIVVKDDKIDILLDKKIVIYKDAKLHKLANTEKVKVDKFGRLNMPGYRVQLLNSTDRALVYQMKGKVYQLYPSQRLYVIAQAPFFKLRFGNFASKAEADRYRKALAPMFPAGVYVVPDIIEGKVQLKKPEDEDGKKDIKKK